MIENNRENNKICDKEKKKKYLLILLILNLLPIRPAEMSHFFIIINNLIHLILMKQ